MASIFGDDGVDDLFNDNIGNNNEQNDLPSDGDGEQLFGDPNNEDDGENLQSGNSEGQKVEPKKRAVRNPRPRLTVDTLRGPRGLHSIEDYFKEMKFKGKGYEKADLDEVLRRMQHWGHRMYPNYTFDDVLNNIERLGKKKPLQVHMSRYRLGQLENLRPNDAELIDNDNDEGNDGPADEPFDEFDALLGEQIALSRLAPPKTPASTSRNFNANTTAMSTSTLATPSFARNAINSTPYSTTGDGGGGSDRTVNGLNDDYSDYAQPLPPSQPATPGPKLSSEQMARIAENRRLAQERLRAKANNNNL